MNCRIHSFIHSSMALQHLNGPWPLFQFHNLIHSRQKSFIGDQPVARPLRTQDNTHTDIQALRGIQNHNSNVQVITIQ
jgi:hypothetical protein